jgi:hypothetical protein
VRWKPALLDLRSVVPPADRLAPEIIAVVQRRAPLSTTATTVWVTPKSMPTLIAQF